MAPEILPENNLLWECFTLCSSQLRISGGGAYAMDWNVVIQVAGVMGLETGPRFCRLLGNFETTLIKCLSENIKRQ
jgi:hypothetical protein